ncbi:Transcriptional regulatory protein AfsQ1 [Thalassocella blandensis]|nr:Transcriptional regulatory protein AfsQ1 [Thalassocella blandensis]
MQNKSPSKADNQRRFNVGLVGNNDAELEVLTRIFTVTNFRNRSYIPVQIDINSFKKQHDVDFILMCSSNPRVVSAWQQSTYSVTHNNRPLIFLARNSEQKLGRYQLSSPINPARLIKLLDYFTISELNYFPEFEIGTDNTNIEDKTMSGLKILRDNALQNPKDQQSKHTALVVDDSLAVRRQMQIEFQLLGDHLEVAASAEEAMQAIESKRYDIIFLDVVMPGMDGYAACKKIKKNKLNASTPVVMLTSRSSSFDKFKGALAGCDAYLVKPINHNEFESVYEKFTDQNITSVNRGQAHAS